MPALPKTFPRPNARLVAVLGGSAVGAYAYRRYYEPQGHPALNRSTFSPYTLVAKQPVSSSSAIFTLRKPNATTDASATDEAWDKGVWSVQVKQPQLQIARSYTPLPAVGEGGAEVDKQDVQLFIRKEVGGEVSNYLHKLPLKSTVELRGPFAELEIPPAVREVLFLAGGTGIAPAIQVAHVLTQRGGAKMRILWATRKRDECAGGESDHTVSDPPSGMMSGWKSFFAGKSNDLEPRGPDINIKRGAVVRMLEDLKSEAGEGNLNVDFYVDEEHTFIKPADVLKHIQGANSRGQSSPSDRMVLVSGPDGFIEYWVGKKTWKDGREAQGSLGGVLSQWDLRGWKVCKL
ncbi:hypothetical protein EJ06DRAFT_533327 [Trichodelitschia bisporula]|uniref:FAD-binding FR-type domain-containing protein n=1 Tax=Trichodelitschia bisporula TaxID=703511 RepID=A0A6G1HMS2_9PEZI|nr:hypothetical protein EJ06DRAFT_533327 [Trichodelitschia bisporula]